jgi:hypothetical protein
METLLRKPLPFETLGTKVTDSQSVAAHTLSGSAAFVSLSSANDFGSALARRIAPFGCWRSARARHKPRRPVGLARLCLDATTCFVLAERGL